MLAEERGEDVATPRRSVLRPAVLIPLAAVAAAIGFAVIATLERQPSRVAASSVLHTSRPSSHWQRPQLPPTFGPVPPYRMFELNGVSASGDDDAWIVGRRPAARGTRTFPFSWRWDGAAWRDKPTPVSAKRSALYGVASVSPDDAWAVGVRGDNGAGQYGRPLALHWNGNRWRRVELPPRGMGILYGVSAASPADVWVVGRAGSDSSLNRDRPLIWRYEDGHWREYHLHGVRGALADVHAASGDDVWFGTTPAESPSPAIVHWDGRRLSEIPVPFSGGIGGLSVAPLGGGHAVAVGWSRGTCVNAHAVPLSEVWNGHAWRNVAVPRRGTDAALSAVAADESGIAWAIGTSANLTYSPNRCEGSPAGGGVRGRPLGMVVMHFDGDRWIAAPAPSVTAQVLGFPTVYGIVGAVPRLAFGSNTGWLVGSNSYGSLVMRFRNGRWVRVPHPPDRVSR